MNNKLLKKIEKLEADIALIEKEKVELLNENNRLQNNNGELIIELKNIHNMSKNAIAKHSAIIESADVKQDADMIKDADMVEDEESQDAAIIIRGISTRLYNAILRYMLNNNMLDKYEDRERKLEEFIIKHESIQSLHISSIGKQSIEEYNSVRRRLMKAIVGE